MRELASYREILLNLVRKELKVEVHGVGPGRRLVDPQSDRVPGGVHVRREDPEQPDAALSGVPALGAAGVEPVLGGAAATGRAPSSTTGTW